MLILAKKKDYYDGVAGTTGIDKTIVYDRQIIEFDEKENPIPILLRRKKWSNDTGPFYGLDYYHLNINIQKKYPHYSYFIVGFCGKLYVGWKLYCEGKSYFNEFGYKIIPLLTEITYDFDYIKSIIDSKSFWKRKGNLENDINYIKNYNAIKLFRDLKTPVFVYDNDYKRTTLEKYWRNNDNKFIVNPLLKEYEFFKMFDAFQAFQEIQMFISGVLGTGEKEITEVADKYKIQQHGFDYKWSFRKEPQEKNGKRNS